MRVSLIFKRHCNYQLQITLRKGTVAQDRSCAKKCDELHLLHASKDSAMNLSEPCNHDA